MQNPNARQYTYLECEVGKHLHESIRGACSFTIGRWAGVKPSTCEILQFRYCTFQGIPPFFSRLPVGRQVLVLHTEKTKPFEAFGHNPGYPARCRVGPLAPYRLRSQGGLPCRASQRGFLRCAPQCTDTKKGRFPS